VNSSILLEHTSTISSKSNWNLIIKRLQIFKNDFWAQSQRYIQIWIWWLYIIEARTSTIKNVCPYNKSKQCFDVSFLYFKIYLKFIPLSESISDSSIYYMFNSYCSVICFKATFTFILILLTMLWDLIVKILMLWLLLPLAESNFTPSLFYSLFV
jgi:hypothetical protein